MTPPGVIAPRPSLFIGTRARLNLSLTCKKILAHARARYAQRANLEYRQADVTRLPFADRSFDVVVSFETLEHLAAQEQLLREFSRVLADDGVLVLSSPDKRTYSDLAGFRNEFHVRELYRDELLALLAPHFPGLPRTTQSGEVILPWPKARTRGICAA